MPRMPKENLLTSVTCRFERDEAKFPAAYGAQCAAGHSALLRAIQCARIKRGESHPRNSRQVRDTCQARAMLHVVRVLVPTVRDD